MSLSRAISDLLDPVAHWLGVREQVAFGLEIPEHAVADFKASVRAFASGKPGYAFEVQDAYRYFARLENEAVSIRIEPRCLATASRLDPNSRPVYSGTEFVVHIYALLVWTDLKRAERSFLAGLTSVAGWRKVSPRQLPAR